MLSIRKTASGSVAVQVVSYTHDQIIVLKHIGSGRFPEEIATLMESARDWIEKETRQSSLFPRHQSRVLPLATTQYLGVTYAFAYDVLCSITKTCGLKKES